MDMKSKQELFMKVSTYVIALNVWERQLLGQVLCHRRLATASRPSDDPNVLMILGFKMAVHVY
jgi:hypothetical protein